MGNCGSPFSKFELGSSNLYLIFTDYKFYYSKTANPFNKWVKPI